jgi:hypothetical protein
MTLLIDIETFPNKAQVMRVISKFASLNESCFNMPYSVYEIQYNQRLCRCDLDISWEALRWGVTEEVIEEFHEKAIKNSLTLDDYCEMFVKNSKIINATLLKKMDTNERRTCLINYIQEKILQHNLNVELTLNALSLKNIYSITSILNRSELLPINICHITYKKKSASRLDHLFYIILNVVIFLFFPIILTLCAIASFHTIFFVILWVLLCFILPLYIMRHFIVTEIDIDKIEIDFCSTFGDILQIVDNELDARRSYE